MANDVSRKVKIIFESDVDKFKAGQKYVEESFKELGEVTEKFKTQVVTVETATGKVQKAISSMVLDTKKDLNELSKVVETFNKEQPTNNVGFARNLKTISETSKSTTTQLREDGEKQTADFKRQIKERLEVHRFHQSMMKAIEADKAKAELQAHKELQVKLNDANREHFSKVESQINQRLDRQRTYANTALGIEQKLAFDIAQVQKELATKLENYRQLALSGARSPTIAMGNANASTNKALRDIQGLQTEADRAKEALQIRQMQESSWRQEAANYRQHQREMQNILEQRLQLDSLALQRNGGRRAVLLQQQANTEANIRRTYAASVQTYERALAQGFISSAQASQYAATALQNMQSQIQSSRAALEQHLTALGGNEQRTQSLGLRVLEMIGLYRIWSSLINTVVAGLKSIPATGIEMQATASALHASLSNTSTGAIDNTGGEIRAVKAMEMLREEAKRTGIDILTLEKNYRTFLASAKMAGESTDTINKIFKDLNTTITALHMTGDRAELTFLALAQMFNKGKIQSEELVKQLGNLLPGAFATFAAATGRKTNELVADMKKGLVGSHENIAKFIAEYARRYSSAFDLAADGLNANVGRMSTAWTNFSRSLFMLVQEDLIAITKFSTGFLEALTPVEYKIQSIKREWELFKQGFMLPFTITHISDAFKAFFSDMDELELRTSKPLQGINLSSLTITGQAKALADEIEKQAKRIEIAERTLSTITPTTSARGGSAPNPLYVKTKEEIDLLKLSLDGLIETSNAVSIEIAKHSKENAIESPNVNALVNSQDKAAAKALRDENAIRKEILDNRLNDLKQATTLEEQIYDDLNRELDKQYKAGLISLQNYSEQAQQLDAELTAKRTTSIREQMSLVQDEITRQQDSLKLSKTTTAESKIITPEIKAGVSKELAQYADFIKTSAKDNGVPEAILFAMMGQESGGNASATSKKNAAGLMQTIDTTFEEVMGALERVNGKLTEKAKQTLYDPQKNIEAGARYFAKKLAAYKDQNEQFLKALAAYNAGEGNVNKAIATGDLTGKDWKNYLPNETKNYIKEIPLRMQKLGITEEDITVATNYTNVVSGTSKTIEALKGKYSELTGELKKAAANQSDYATKVHETALAEMERIANKYATPDEVYAKEIALLDQLRVGIEGVTLAESAYQKEKAAALEKRDTANEKAFADATKPTSELKEYNSWLEKVDESYKSLAVSSQDFFSGNSNWIDKLANSFNALSKTLNKISNDELKGREKFLAAYEKEQAASEKTKDPKEKAEYTKRLLKMEQDYTKSAQQLDAERYSAQVQGITAVSMALVEGLNSRSDSEQAAARKTVQAQMVVLGQAVALAVANQAAGGDPYTVWIRIAAVVATLASFGISRSGAGTGTPKIDTKTQGTVLGDRQATSKSTEEIVTIMKDVHASEYSALLDINDSIKDLSDSILTAITGIFQRGDLATPVMPADKKIGLASGISKNVSQNVLRGKGATLGEIFEGYMLQLEQFLEIKTTKSFLFGNLVKNQGTINAVSEQTNKDVTAVFKNIGRVLMDAGEVFGMDVEAAVKALRIPDLNIDIKDMTGEEAVKYFNAYISTLMDTLAADTYPLLSSYQQLGEGMAQTVVRVAADVGILKSTFDDMGLTIPSTSESLIGLAEALVKVAGDTDKFRENLSSFYTNFYTENEQLLNKLDFMTNNLSRFGITMPTSRQEYRQTTLGKLTEAGSAQTDLTTAKNRLDAATKAAFEPFKEELALLKSNAEKYGEFEKKMYARVLAEREAYVNEQIQGEQAIYNAAQERATQTAKGANLLLEQADNADALYSALEKSQELLYDFGTTTQTKLKDGYASFATEITALGLAVPTSVQEFKNLIAVQDLSTESGRKTAAALLLMADKALELNDAARQAAEEFESIRVMGFSISQTENLINNLTTSFGDLGSGLQYLQGIIKGFTTDVQGDAASVSYYTEKQQQLIDSNESLRNLNIKAGMSSTDIMRALGVSGSDIGKYLATPGLDIQTDPAAQFLRYSSLIGDVKGTTAQNLLDQNTKQGEDYNEQMKKAQENEKKFLEIQENVNTAIANFAASNADKKIMAVNKEITDLSNSVKDLGQGALEGLDNLKQLKLGLVNKELFDSLRPILEISNKLGLTNIDLATTITKDEKGLWSFSQEATELLPKLTQVTENLDVFKNALTALDEATSTVAQSNMSDAAKQVFSLLDSGKKGLATVKTALDLQYGKGDSPEKTNILRTMTQALGVQLSEVFKPLLTEVSAAGLTTYEKDLADLNKEMGDWQQALELAKDTLAPEEYTKYADALKRVQEIRTKALREEADSIMEASRQSFARLEASDLESELYTVLDSTANTIASLIQAGGTISEVMDVYWRGFWQGAIIVKKAKEELETTFKDIYKSITATATSIEEEILSLQDPKKVPDFQKQRAMELFNQASVAKNYQDQLSAIESVHSAIMESYSTQIETINSLKDLTQSIRDYLKDLKLDRGLTPLSPEKQLTEARTQFRDLLALAQTGDQDALGKITGNASKYLDIAKAYFASTPEYVAIFDEVQKSLSDLAAPVNYEEQIATATANSVKELQNLLSLTEVVRKEQKAYEKEKLEAINNSAYNLSFELSKTVLELKEFKDSLGVNLQQQFIATLNKFKDIILNIKVIPNIPLNLIDLADEVTRTMQLSVIAVAGADLPESIRKLALDDLDLIAKGVQLVTETSLDPVAIAMALGVAGSLSKTVQYYATVSGLSDEARTLGLQATSYLQKYATYSITSSLDEAAKNMELGTLRVANKYVQAVVTSNLDQTAKQLKLDNLDVFLKDVFLAIETTGQPTPDQQAIIDLADRTLKDMSLGMSVNSQLDSFEQQILGLDSQTIKQLQVSAIMSVIGSMTAGQVIDLYNKAAGPDQEVIVRAIGNFIEMGSLNYAQISNAYAMATGVDQQSILTITSNLLQTGALTIPQMVDTYLKASGPDQEAMLTLTSNLAKTGIFSMQEVSDVYNKVVAGNKGVEYSITAKRGTTWDDNAAKLATSGLTGTTSTVVTSAVLTLDQVLNNSILSYSKADVQFAYGSIMDNTANTNLNVIGAKNTLDAIYSRLWNIEVYTSRSAFYNEHLFNRITAGVMVYSQYRYGNLATFADGGISNVPAIFGDAGPEAAVPLPDGRTIPVSFTNAQSGSAIKTEEMLAEMRTQTDEIRRSRQETTVRQDAMIQRLAQVEKRLAQLEATTSIGVVR